MKPWEVWQWEFPHGSHPAVIVSPEARCANPDIQTVNVAELLVSPGAPGAMGA